MFNAEVCFGVDLFQHLIRNSRGRNHLRSLSRADDRGKFQSKIAVSAEVLQINLIAGQRCVNRGNFSAPYCFYLSRNQIVHNIESLNFNVSLVDVAVCQSLESCLRRVKIPCRIINICQNRITGSRHKVFGASLQIKINPKSFRSQFERIRFLVFQQTV